MVLFEIFKENLRKTMSCKTQMMKKSPELFYLFRRAFSTFCLLFIYNNGFGQIYENGKEIVFANENLKSDSTIIYISEGTYVHGLQQRSFEKKKDTKNVNKILSAKNKQKTRKKYPVIEKNKAKPVILFHCSSPDKNQILYSSHLSKIVFAGNSHDYHNKFFENIPNWYSSSNYRFLSSKIISRKITERLQYFFDGFKVRPPPVFPPNTYDFKNA